MHGVVVIFHSDLDLDLHTTFLLRSSLCSCSTVAFFHHCSMSKSLQSIRPALEWRAAQHGAVGFAWSLGAPRHFVWQVWHLVTLTSVLRGRCGTHGGGLKMVYTHKVAVWMGKWGNDDKSVGGTGYLHVRQTHMKGTFAGSLSVECIHIYICMPATGCLLHTSSGPTFRKPCFGKHVVSPISGKINGPRYTRSTLFSGFRWSCRKRPAETQRPAAACDLMAEGFFWSPMYYTQQTRSSQDRWWHSRHRWRDRDHPLPCLKFQQKMRVQNHSADMFL